MKHLLFISALVVILFSCNKEISQNLKSFSLISNIKHQLKDSISANDFLQLDFNNSVITNNTDKDLSLLRIPFTNKSIATDFLLLKIEKNQFFSKGKIINIYKDQTDLSPKTLLRFNGRINIFSLDRNHITASAITNGYIEAFNTTFRNNILKEAVVEIPLMPDVVIICNYPPSGGGYSLSDLYNLQNMLSGSGSSGSSGSTGEFDGGYSSNGGGGYYYLSNPNNNAGENGGNNGGGGSIIPKNSTSVLIDYESAEILPTIDLKKYLNCFNNIPDAGATCTIKILTDIPVDKDPNAFFDWANGSPGHTFLEITKVNGKQSVQQNIGFYPIKGWKTVLTTAPTEGKFADNYGHEFNASLTMDLTPEKLQHTLTHIQNLANFIKYDIDEYNCTDFALDVFNYQRGGNQLTIPMYDIPGGTATKGTATPQGLYQKLTTMKQLGDVDSKNVTIPGLKGFAGHSNGPCD